MGLLNIFKKPAPQAQPKPPEPTEDASVYSQMRVEVTTRDEQMLFVAKLMYPRQDTAELHQYSDLDIPLPRDRSESEPLPVHIRGYHDRLRKAVYMEGLITPQPHRIWKVTGFHVARVGNDRAFFRLTTDLPAQINKFSGQGAGIYPCRLLNISVGGARIASDRRYWEGDKLLLTVKLLEDRDPSIMYCQVLRVIGKEDGTFEYGCCFMEMNDAVQDKITESIFAAQLKTRSEAKSKSKSK